MQTPRSIHDEPGAFPLLGTLRATRNDIRRASLLVGVLVVAFFATAPFAERQWPVVPAFIPVYDVAIAFLSLFTAVLLHAHYRGERSAAYLWLSCGYGFSAMAALVHGLSVADAFSPGRLFGGPQTSAWLWMSWHGLFPLFVLGFFWAVTRRGIRSAWPAVTATRAYVAVAALVVALVVTSTYAEDSLPELVNGMHFGTMRLRVLIVAWFLHVVAIACMIRRARERRLIDLWITVALVADAIDLALGGLLVTGRYQLGFYVGRMYGLVTAMSVLALLLLQMFELQRRFVQARLDLRMHERRYTDLFGSMSEAFYVVEAVRDGDQVTDLRVVDRNPAAAAVVPAEAIGQSLRDVDPEFDPRWLDVVSRVLATGEPEDFEWTHDDRIFAYRVFRAEHLHDQVGILFDDVTDARLAEAALADSEARQRILVQGVPQLLWRTDDQGRSTWVSPQWYTYTGQSVDTVVGTGAMEAVHPDDRERTRTLWTAAQQTGRLDVEHRLRASDGSYRWHRSRSEPHYDAEGRIESWLGSSTDIHDLKSLQDRQSVLVAELQHRTRNILAVVRALADRTVRDSRDMDEFKPIFRDRVDALARAQSLLSRLDSADRVTFEELLQTEVCAISGVRAAQDDGRIVLEGTRGVRLRSSTVQTLALALHELTVNALKYGALSAANGHLEVRWFVEHDADRTPQLHVVWKESGLRVDPAAPVQGGGYGRELIERALPYQLGAKTSYAIEPDGVRCEIVMPVSVQTATGEAMAPARAAAAR
ncbi:MASE4 domain-containing protein [Lysobacter sp. TY2-98]|uniref:MASE4 domain-containing protein n=1 Tax=Lysobacter sp. TY2-98 TaxID=2290922 RepID=UPI0019646FBF|nr:MASE4 domain-containing protein [Lysobacter sp. TY2-98]